MRENKLYLFIEISSHKQRIWYAMAWIERQRPNNAMMMVMPLLRTTIILSLYVEYLKTYSILSRFLRTIKIQKGKICALTHIHIYPKLLPSIDEHFHCEHLNWKEFKYTHWCAFIQYTFCKRKIAAPHRNQR